MRLRAENSRPSGTRAPAATIEPSPIFAPLRIVALIPIRQPSPISHPCTTARWPTTQPSPTTAGYPGSACSTQPSWTFVRAPIRIGSVSPRNTAPYQTLDCSPKYTAPITKAPGATKEESATSGLLSPKGSKFPIELYPHQHGLTPVPTGAGGYEISAAASAPKEFCPAQPQCAQRPDGPAKLAERHPPRPKDHHPLHCCSSVARTWRHQFIRRRRV